MEYGTSRRKNPRLALNIREVADLSAVTTPTFAHSRIGRNGQPLSKIEAFANALRHRGESVVDVAFMKFCYTDFSGSAPKFRTSSVRMRRHSLP